MPRVVGVVAEFNPFHNGHRYLLEAVRLAFPGCSVAAAMSGNFVQRGEPAITEKRIRAQAALRGGADLIIELPAAYAVAPARRFAAGGIALLRECGCDTLAFGSECGDAGALQALAAHIETPELTAVMRKFLGDGLTFAKARELAAAELLGRERAALLAAPNNTLAVEYLRAAAGLGWRPGLFTVPRRGVAHDSDLAAGELASASLIRRNAGDFGAIRGYVPCPALYEAARRGGFWPLNREKFDLMQLSYLRRLTREELAGLPDLSEGLEGRLSRAIRSARSLAEICEAAKTKRYPMARIRRLLLLAFLGVTAGDADAPPPYLRVLGMTERGKQLLKHRKAHSALPSGTSLSRLGRLSAACARTAELEARATDLYTAALPNPLPCGYDESASAVFPGKWEPVTIPTARL